MPVCPFNWPPARRCPERSAELTADLSAPPYFSVSVFSLRGQQASCELSGLHSSGGRACVRARKNITVSWAPLASLPYCTPETHFFRCFVCTQTRPGASMFVWFSWNSVLFWPCGKRKKEERRDNTVVEILSRCFERVSLQLCFKGDPWTAIARRVHSMNNLKKLAFHHAGGKSSIVRKREWGFLPNLLKMTFKRLINVHSM